MTQVADREISDPGSALCVRRSPDGRFGLRPPQPSDVSAVASELREVDLLDIAAFSSENAGVIIPHWLAGSRKAFALEFESRTAAVGGVIPTTAGQAATLWAIGSHTLDRAFRAGLLRHTRAWFGDYADGEGPLACYPAARNTVDIRWIEWLGFRPTHILHSRRLGGIDCVRLQYDATPS